ncbi:glycine zipper 2TM domain-containing protein [Massilia sp. Dwa41.01b]|uniref:glycine zipper 2TM domain-containing protein n=1 Tax=Massilia sp. Dwa41.01b TaxID=2709302 RepID=UPI0015FED7F0|nr:glycine zipper 2TM domain-containing protein [Massilia sp. Dwa41.01b]QNA89902.1 glycine zipper 2TM domain-containing protein [Massilia sp. Dwa41.01b]
MKSRAILSSLLCALLPLGPMALAPLPALAQQHARDQLPVPEIRGFGVDEVGRIAPGVELRFDLVGTSGAEATVKIEGATRNLRLSELDPGHYVGSYTVGAHDRIRNGGTASADLRLGPRFVSATLREPLVREGATPPTRRELAAQRATATPQTARYCTNCATVEAVNVVQVQGEAGMMGTAGGAVVGALLGNQVGSGSGRTAATVAGAVGGGIVGRNIERNAHRSQRYEVVVRYGGNNATQTLKYDNDPGFRVGDAVRVNNGVLSRDQ